MGSKFWLKGKVSSPRNHKESTLFMLRKISLNCLNVQFISHIYFILYRKYMFMLEEQLVCLFRPYD